MMQVILVYDITNDQIRTKIADACMDYGLDRIQYSAFAGRLSRNHQEELMMRLERLLTKGVDGGKIQLIPICMKDWSERLEVEHARR